MNSGLRDGRRTLLMYGELAPWYDLIYETKDYRGEAATLRRLVRKYGPPRSRSWLDVACGAGGHLVPLRRSFAVEGVDLSREMLRVARKRLPGVPLHPGDMRTFRLGREFDVVSCLFSAIGHLRSRREVGRAFANFARHLNPGGLMIVEPWIAPADFRPRGFHLVTRQRPDRTIVRLAVSSRRGDRSIVDYHYLVGARGKGVRYLHELDTGVLLAPSQLLELAREAGLAPRFLQGGLGASRGLLVARRPIGSR